MTRYLKMKMRAARWVEGARKRKEALLNPANSKDSFEDSSPKNDEENCQELLDEEDFCEIELQGRDIRD